MQGFVSWFVILRIQHTCFSRYESSVFLPNRIGIFNQLGAFLFSCTETTIFIARKRQKCPFLMQYLIN